MGENRGKVEDMMYLYLYIVLVVSLTYLGVWLKGINGIHGWVDEFFTPIPLSIIGLGYMVFELS